MPAPGWYNSNSARAYPFQVDTVDQEPSGPTSLLQFPNTAVVDAGFIIGPAVHFQTGVHQVYLARLRRLDDIFYFDFLSDAPGLAGAYLTFSRALGGEKYLTEHAESEETTELSMSPEDCDEPLWSGFLVTGDLADLELLLTGDGELTRHSGSACIVEPSLLQNLDKAYVTALGLANEDRTRATNPDNCPPIVWPYPTGELFINSNCLTDVIRIKPGYNCVVRQNDRENSITISPVVGAGEGEPCDSVPLFDTEVPPTGSTLLEGGPRCNEVVRSFNGTGGRLFRIVGGAGVSVDSDPGNHTVIIDVNMFGLATCQPDSDSYSDSCGNILT